MTNKNQQQQIDAIRNDLSTLHDDIGELVGIVKDFASVNDDAPGLNERLREGMEHSMAWARDAGSRAEKNARAGIKAARHQVQERPLATLAIAVGVGALVGQILSRRR